MTSLKFIGLIDVDNANNSSSFCEGNIGVDKTGQLHCFVDGRFIPIHDNQPRPEKAIDYLYNHKKEFTSFKDILDFVYSYSIGQHPDISMDTLRSMEIMCRL